MLKLLSEKVEGNFIVTEYTVDGINISHTIKIPLREDGEFEGNLELVQPQPTIEEKILAENQYQTMLLELTTFGGM